MKVCVPPSGRKMDKPKRPLGQIRLTDQMHFLQYQTVAHKYTF